MTKKTERSSRDNSKATLLIVLVVAMALVGALIAATNTQESDDKDSSGPSPVENPAPATVIVAAAPTATREAVPTATTELPPIGIEKGNRAPDFTLDSIDGELSLYDFHGQVVMINFWASWCGPCRMEMPDVKAMYEKYRDQGFVVIGVNIGETADTVASFAEQFELAFPMMLDAQAQVARQFGAYSIPTSYFLDRQGVIRDARAGALPASFIEQVITPLLDES